MILDNSVEEKLQNSLEILLLLLDSSQVMSAIFEPSAQLNVISKTRGSMLI